MIIETKRRRTISINKWLDVKPELKRQIRMVVEHAQKFSRDQKWVCEQYQVILDRWHLTQRARAELSGYFDAYRETTLKTQFAYKLDGKLYGTSGSSFFPHYKTLGLSEKDFYYKSKESGTYYQSGEVYHDNSTFNQEVK